MDHPLDAVERRPHTAIWEITRLCNLRCVHCENQSGELSVRELSYDRCVEVAGSLARLGCRVVDLTGGEPLLRPDWYRLAETLTELGMRVAVITNGTLLDERALEKAADADVERLGISVDGLKETHDAIRRRGQPGPSPFEETMTGLKRAVNRFPVNVVTVVNRHNLKELPKLGRMLRDLGVERWQLQLAIPTGRLFGRQDAFVIHPADLEKLAQFIADSRSNGQTPFIHTSDSIGYYSDQELALRRSANGQGVWLGCQAGIRVVAITYDGRVRGCSALPREFDCGDLHQETLAEIWRDEERFAFSTRFDPLRLEGECAQCKFGALCRAGCTSMAYWTTGSIYHNPYCLLGQRMAKYQQVLTRESIPITQRRDHEIG